jgi:hypothetical protein
MESVGRDNSKLPIKPNARPGPALSFARAPKDAANLRIYISLDRHRNRGQLRPVLELDASALLFYRVTQSASRVWINIRPFIGCQGKHCCTGFDFSMINTGSVVPASRLPPKVLDSRRSISGHYSAEERCPERLLTDNKMPGDDKTQLQMRLSTLFGTTPGNGLAWLFKKHWIPGGSQTMNTDKSQPSNWASNIIFCG